MGVNSLRVFVRGDGCAPQGGRGYLIHLLKAWHLGPCYISLFDYRN